MRFILTMVFLINVLFALDSDFDGVSDKEDRCPNTPLMAMVNSYGCKIDKQVPINFDLKAGISKSEISDLKVKSLLLNINAYYKTKQLNITAAKAKILNFTGYHTSLLKVLLYQKFNYKEDFFKVGVGVDFATHYDNDSDMIFKVTYYNNSTDSKIINRIKYKNKKTKYMFFVQKYFRKGDFFVSPYFYVQNSFEDRGKWNKFVGFMINWNVNQRIYIESSYTKIINFGKNYNVVFAIGVKY